MYRLEPKKSHPLMLKLRKSMKGSVLRLNRALSRLGGQLPVQVIRAITAIRATAAVNN